MDCVAGLRYDFSRNGLLVRCHRRGRQGGARLYLGSLINTFAVTLEDQLIDVSQCPKSSIKCWQLQIGSFDKVMGREINMQSAFEVMHKAEAAIVA
jgi:hypothetical protein